MVEVGKYYRNSVGDYFVVEDAYSNSRGDWVVYSNKATKQQFECLKNAFLARFSIITNKRYS